MRKKIEEELKAQAIAFIKDDIDCHREWAAYIRRHPRKSKQKVVEVEAVGDVSHHRRWIRRLNLVLKALQS